VDIGKDLNRGFPLLGRAMDSQWLFLILLPKRAILQI
jgi:hypothetical protein